MHAVRRFAAFLSVLALSASAQTYTPRAIHLQGAGSVDQAEILRLIALTPGNPVTREQIEAAMQRLADSGLFADLRYTVDTAALTFILQPVAGAQAQTVRFANFVWWRPGELEPLVEARVPLFRGKLPLTGQLTSQVEAALVTLLAEKGISGASIEAMQSTVGGGGVALTITQPTVNLGDLHLAGVAPEAAEQMNLVDSRLAGREFDSAETASTIVENTLETHRNAGYLDVAVDAPVFSAPRKEAHGYAVDASANVHPGPLYHVTAIRFTGIEPSLEPELARASGLKVGDPAQQMTARIAAGLTTRLFTGSGHLEAKSSTHIAKDTTAHTVAYTFELTPGPVYHFAGTDASELSTDAQARFNSAFHVHPGVLADHEVTRELVHAMQVAGVSRTAAIRMRLNTADRTVTYVLVSKSASGTDVSATDGSQP